MRKGLRSISIAIITFIIGIIIAIVIVFRVTKPHTELLGSWILSEEPVENVKTTMILYFYGYDNFKYDYYINLDYTGNEKSDEAKGTYTLDTKNKKIKLKFENGNTMEVGYKNNDKIQLISDTDKDYIFVSNETSKALEEVFKEKAKWQEEMNK